MAASASASASSTAFQAVEVPSSVNVGGMVSTDHVGAVVTQVPNPIRLYRTFGKFMIEIELTSDQRDRIKKCHEQALEAINGLGGDYANLKLNVENIRGIDAKYGIIEIFNPTTQKVEKISINGDTSKIPYLKTMRDIVESHCKGVHITCYNFTDRGSKCPNSGFYALSKNSGTLKAVAATKDDSWAPSSPPTGLLPRFGRRLVDFMSTSRRALHQSEQVKDQLRKGLEPSCLPGSVISSEQEFDARCKEFDARCKEIGDLQNEFEKCIKDEQQKVVKEISIKNQAIHSKESELAPLSTTGENKGVRILALKEKLIPDLMRQIDSNPTNKTALVQQKEGLFQELKTLEAEVQPLKDNIVALEAKITVLQNKLKAVQDLDITAIKAVLFVKCHGGSLSTPEDRLKAAKLLKHSMENLAAVNMPILSVLAKTVIPDMLCKHLDQAYALEEDENVDVRSLLSTQEKEYCAYVASMLLKTREEYCTFAAQSNIAPCPKPFEEFFLEALEESMIALASLPATGATVVVAASPAASAAAAVPPPSPVVGTRRVIAEKYLGLKDGEKQKEYPRPVTETVEGS
jgi:hypothetical protein